MLTVTPSAVLVTVPWEDVLVFPLEVRRYAARLTDHALLPLRLAGVAGGTRAAARASFHGATARGTRVVTHHDFPLDADCPPTAEELRRRSLRAGDRARLPCTSPR